MANDKVKPRTLRAGDQILVSRSGNDLRHATMKRDSLIARVMSPPEIADSPTPGARRGYAISTDLGRIPFITGVSSIMIPSPADIRRYERETASREQAQAESQGVLGGLSMSDEQRAAAVVPAAAARSAPAQRAHVQPPPPAKVSASAGQGIPMARGANAAANYRTMARGAETDAARAFWERLAREALA